MIAQLWRAFRYGHAAYRGRKLGIVARETEENVKALLRGEGVERNTVRVVHYYAQKDTKR